MRQYQLKHTITVLNFTLYEKQTNHVLKRMAVCFFV